MTRDLESPNSSEDLYRGRGREISQARPLLTGDVLRIEGSTELVMLIEHPCNMRTDGVQLKPRIHVVRVENSQPIPIPWKGHYRKMPLDDLLSDGEFYAANFDNAEYVGAGQLGTENREVALELVGINLLHQRYVHHMTRVVVPTLDFRERIIGEFEEIELMEQWAEAAMPTGTAPEAAWEECHKWLREAEPEDGVTRQQRLRDAGYRPAIRRAAKYQIESLYG